MKRTMAILVILCMTLCMSCAYAQEEPTELQHGVVTPVESDVQLDLDGDGTAEHILYEVEVGEDGYDTGYTLRINDTVLRSSGYSMNRQLHVLSLASCADSAFLLVSDYGPSDDPETSLFYWDGSAICSAGTIYAMPEDWTLSGNDVITARIRGKLLQTWYHEADYALGVKYDEEWNESYYVCPIPRYVYPIGTIVTLKVDLPLMASMTNSEIAATLPKGSEAILCATDDVEWVYIEARDGFAGGWMRVVGDYGYECAVGDEVLSSDEVFDGLIFAD